MRKPRRSLFDVPAQARHDDPASSHEAARKVTKSGTAAERRRTLLKAVREFPGETSAELAQRLNRDDLDRVEVARRLPDMRDRLKIVCNGRRRKCRVTGNHHSLTWIAIAPATMLAPPSTASSPPTPPVPRKRRTKPPAGLADLPAATPPPTMPAAADSRAAELLAWFEQNRDRLPAEPFELRPGERVSNPAKFYAALQADVAAGPTARYMAQTIPAPRWAPLLADLQRLKTITEELAR